MSSENPPKPDPQEAPPPEEMPFEPLKTEDFVASDISDEVVTFEISPEPAAPTESGDNEND